LAQGCVDDEMAGESAKLLLLESPIGPVAPGETLEVVFQAADEVGTGVPDQRLEVLVTDFARLRFADAPCVSRSVVLTGRHVEAGGVSVEGAVVLKLVVPPAAKAGRVTLIGSLEGKRAESSKTRWVEIEVAEPKGEGGAGGGAADPTSAMDPCTMGGTGGTSNGGSGGAAMGGVAGTPDGGAGATTSGGGGSGGLADNGGSGGSAQGGIANEEGGSTMAGGEAGGMQAP
jgi:hypothetical protein